MKKYVVAQSFHFGEVCQDIYVGAEIFFDEATGRIKLGDFEHDVRVAPILGAIKKGWLRLAEDARAEKETEQKFEGVQEARPVPGKAAAKEKKEEKFAQIEYEDEAALPVDPKKEVEEKKKEKIKIGREDREETDAIEFTDLKNLKEEDDSEIIKAWDLSEHWQKRKKKIKAIKNINTLMRLASLDGKMKSHIEKHIKELSNLGEEVDHKVSSLNALEEKKADKEKKAAGKKKAGGKKKASGKKKVGGKKKAGKKKATGKKPKKAPLGQDFDEYLNDQVQSGEIQNK